MINHYLETPLGDQQVLISLPSSLFALLIIYPPPQFPVMT